MVRGKFITFEGGEGAGKSTQARLLADRLALHGLVARVTREPGGTPFAEQVRDMILSRATAPHGALAETLLFYAARADHLDQIVRPALARGEWVISDRFSDSTRAYQGAAGGVPQAVIDGIERIVVGTEGPDLTILLDLEATAGLARARGRAPDAVDAYEARKLEFHERLRQGFLEIARAEPHRVVVLDGAQPIAAIAERVWADVARRFGIAHGATGAA
ncbi:MAG: dTMP kinase [Hyphomicrobiales bacterium]|nr:dTMP kinase [Hyphomicrobiales bacterium]